MNSHRRTIRSAALAVAIAAIGATVIPATAASAAPASESANVVREDPSSATAQREDDLKGPLTDSQQARKQQAIEQVISGKSTVKDRDGSKVVKLSGGKYVELAREKTDKIFTILAEFGDGISQYGGTAGPARNEIAEPDRSTDNSTAWQADYNQAHFQDLYFSTAKNKESLKKFYEKASSGRYSVDGQVQDWVKVDYNEASYGSNDCDTCVWNLVSDAVTKWVAAREAAGDTAAEIKAQLASYDEYDRYDYDGDGDFNEPDGYIDHFQIVHAGEDESAGGGAQGTDAIWAHRWYAYGTDAGNTGPADNKLGGAQIGDTGIWVGDYTIQPENGGLGVFAHEYGHDLGLPDNYDTNGAENSTGFWDLMSSGSWLGTGKQAIGDLPGEFSAWDKLQLGWLNYKVVQSATKSVTKLGVAEYNTKDKQALIVALPKKTVTTELVTPASGSYQWWSGKGNSLSNTLARDVDLTGKSAATLSLKGWYAIENAYDHLYTEVSTDGGSSWTPIDGTVGGAAIPRDGSDQPALTGSVESYQDLVYPLDAYAGQSIKLRFRYATDSGLALNGFAADDITVTADGSALFTDGAETGGDSGWTADGFTVKGASYSGEYPQYYIAENRQYVSYDKTLKVGPYNFGFVDTKDNWVEHFPYQNGLLIWLWDTSQSDNNVSAHPGQGLILPVDAHAKPLKWSDGTYMRQRIQSYDSTFTLEPTDGVTLHKLSVATKIKSQKGVSVFDDRKGTYYYAATPYAGVQVPDTNTRISILTQSKNGSTVTVAVGASTK